MELIKLIKLTTVVKLINLTKLVELIKLITLVKLTSLAGRCHRLGIVPDWEVCGNRNRHNLVKSKALASLALIFPSHMVHRRSVRYLCGHSR